MPEKIYIGTKVIAAKPMSEAQWGLLKGFIPEQDRPGYRVRYEDGYVSWSPKEVFERAYREISEKEMAIIGQKEEK